MRLQGLLAAPKPAALSWGKARCAKLGKNPLRWAFSPRSILPCGALLVIVRGSEFPEQLEFDLFAAVVHLHALPAQKGFSRKRTREGYFLCIAKFKGYVIMEEVYICKFIDMEE